MKILISTLLVLWSISGYWAVGSTIYDITNFGAVGDGTTLNTEAIQSAIDSAYSAGGGKVIVPPGAYLTGGIELRSFVNLEVMAGARLLGTNQLEQYAMHPGTDQHGRSIERRYLISVMNAEQVTISGQGIIDGQGEVYWELPASPPPQWIRARPERPKALLEVANSRNVILRDITLTRSPNWTCHILHSQDILIDGIRIANDLFAPNADGIDITGSQRVRVSNCDIKTCDDAIVLKTWKGGQSCEDIVVTNCTLETLCAALKLGTESYADFRRVTFNNCTVRAASRLFAIYVRDGGTVEDVQVANIAGSTRAPLVLNRPIQLMISRRNPESPLGRIRNISIRQMACETDGRILLTAVEGAMIEDLRIQDMYLRYPFIENPSLNGETVRSSQFPLEHPDVMTARAAIVAQNLVNFQISGLQIVWPEAQVPETWQIPVRIINGDFDKKFRHDYRQPRQVELGVLWGRNLQAGALSKLTATASHGEGRGIDIRESSFVVPQ